MHHAHTHFVYYYDCTVLLLFCHTITLLSSLKALSVFTCIPRAVMVYYVILLCIFFALLTIHPKPKVLFVLSLIGFTLNWILQMHGYWSTSVHGRGLEKETPNYKRSA